MVQTGSIAEKYNFVSEGYDVVAVCGFHIKGFRHGVLKIKVLRHDHVVDAPYSGLANYGINTPDQGGSYLSVKNCKTIDEAVDDALRGFMSYFKPELDEKTEYELTEDW